MSNRDEASKLVVRRVGGTWSVSTPCGTFCWTFDRMGDAQVYATRLLSEHGGGLVEVRRPNDAPGAVIRVTASASRARSAARDARLTGTARRRPPPRAGWLASRGVARSG